MVIIDSVYRNFSSPYPKVQSPTSYDVPFSRNTCVTDRQMTDRHIASKAGPKSEYRSLKFRVMRFFDKRILKIGQRLAKIWTNERWRTGKFLLGNTVYYIEVQNRHLLITRRRFSKAIRGRKLQTARRLIHHPGMADYQRITIYC